MNKFESTLEVINDFYKIPQPADLGNYIFETLSKIIEFKSGYIFYGDKLEYTYNFQQKIKEPYLKEDLIFKNSVFGQIIITGEKFSNTDKKIFGTCASVISNICKDSEISKIIKMQIKALQEGYLKVQKNNKKIKTSEQVKTKFISHISHEIRTPINSILGYSELLNKELAGGLNDKQKEFVNDINISALRLLEIVNGILDMSKIEAGAMKMNYTEFAIKDCIQEVLNIIKPLLIQKDLMLKQNIENFKIKADYLKTQQILFNLLSNAIKYTPSNGEIFISCKKEQNYKIISIKDTGIGIDRKNLKKIFKKFEQTGKAQPNSTGLGLSIVKEFTKLHNWEIVVNSAINKGSEFKILIQG